MRSSAIIISAILSAALLMVHAVTAKGGTLMAFTISSPDFNDGEAIPKMHTCEGDDMSPELRWKDEPAGTRSYVLIVDDPDAPGGTFTHWVVYDIPATVHEITRGMGNVSENMDISETIKEGKSGFGHPEYGGPCPPKGHGRHRYYFTLKALDTESLGLPPGAPRTEVELAIQGHVLGEAKTMGVFER